jgi:hypothetical protein
MISNFVKKEMTSGGPLAGERKIIYIIRTQSNGIHMTIVTNVMLLQWAYLHYALLWN